MFHKIMNQSIWIHLLINKSSRKKTQIYIGLHYILCIHVYRLCHTRAVHTHTHTYNMHMCNLCIMLGVLCIGVQLCMCMYVCFVYSTLVCKCLRVGNLCEQRNICWKTSRTIVT